MLFTLSYVIGLCCLLVSMPYVIRTTWCFLSSLPPFRASRPWLLVLIWAYWLAFGESALFTTFWFMAGLCFSAAVAMRDVRSLLLYGWPSFVVFVVALSNEDRNDSDAEVVEKQERIISQLWILAVAHMVHLSIPGLFPWACTVAARACRSCLSRLGHLLAKLDPSTAGFVTRCRVVTDSGALYLRAHYRSLFDDLPDSAVVAHDADEPRDSIDAVDCRVNSNDAGQIPEDGQVGSAGTPSIAIPSATLVPSWLGSRREAHRLETQRLDFGSDIEMPGSFGSHLADWPEKTVRFKDQEPGEGRDAHFESVWMRADRDESSRTDSSADYDYFGHPRYGGRFAEPWARNRAFSKGKSAPVVEDAAADRAGVSESDYHEDVDAVGEEPEVSADTEGEAQLAVGPRASTEGTGHGPADDAIARADAAEADRVGDNVGAQEPGAEEEAEGDGARSSRQHAEFLRVGEAPNGLGMSSSPNPDKKLTTAEEPDAPGREAEGEGGRVEDHTGSALVLHAQQPAG